MPALLISLVSVAQVSPYATKIISYCPAPGQYINDTVAGTPSAALATTGEPSRLVSLGAFGGYIIYGFDHRVLNDPQNPYGIDFTVFGNASSTFSEPGIIYVMKDGNENGLPDDTWYEIAGSDHYLHQLNRDYQVTYYNPG